MASNKSLLLLSTNDLTKDYKKGYPKEVLVCETVEQKYLCSICLLVLRLPVQSFCGHRYCDLCLKHLIGNGEEQVTCPECVREKWEHEDIDLRETCLLYTSPSPRDA